MKGHVYNRNGVQTITGENLVNIMKEMFFKLKLSNTQWKMLTNMADKEKSGHVDVELFFMMLGNNAKLNKAIPK
jgi:Ca2+-binding EF-hand superfamily protein